MPGYNKENFNRWRIENRDYLKSYIKNWRKNLKEKVFNHYSNNDIKCACCGERNIMFLTLDHINNDGAKHRREIGINSRKAGGEKIHTWIIKNDFPPGFQILCFNCNCGKNINNGICPHNLP